VADEDRLEMSSCFKCKSEDTDEFRQSKKGTYSHSLYTRRINVQTTTTTKATECLLSSYHSTETAVLKVLTDILLHGVARPVRCLSLSRPRDGSYVVLWYRMVSAAGLLFTHSLYHILEVVGKTFAAGLKTVLLFWCPARVDPRSNSFYVVY